MKKFLLIALLALGSCAPKITKEKTTTIERDTVQVFKTDTVKTIEIRERVDTTRVPSIIDSAKAITEPDGTKTVSKKSKNGDVKKIRYSPTTDEFYWNVQPDDIFKKQVDTNITTEINKSSDTRITEKSKDSIVLKQETQQKKESPWQRFKSNFFYVFLGIFILLMLLIFLKKF